MSFLDRLFGRREPEAASPPKKSAPPSKSAQPAKPAQRQKPAQLPKPALLGLFPRLVALLGSQSVHLLKQPQLIVRSLIAAVAFTVFMQAFHLPVGPSELHFLGAMPLYLALGFVPQVALNVIEPTVVATLNQARISDPVVPLAEK